jgi:hypothetical protein
MLTVDDAGPDAFSGRQFPEAREARHKGDRRPFSRIAVLSYGSQQDTDMIDLTQSPPSEKTLAANGDRTLGNFNGSPSDINMSPPSFDISMLQAMPSPSPSSDAPESAPRSTAPIRSPLANATNLRRVTFAPLVEERRMSPARPSLAPRDSVSHGRAWTVLGQYEPGQDVESVTDVAYQVSLEAAPSPPSSLVLQKSRNRRRVNPDPV